MTDRPLDVSPHTGEVDGLHRRPGTDDDVVSVAAGATRHVRFVAGAPGTYLYYGRTPDGLRRNQRLHDALLGGALVVDPPGPTPADRIFVLERWDGPTRTAINGKSWPFTERLDYTVGERVHWKVINASDLSHPMHLHGFHFELDAVGDASGVGRVKRIVNPSRSFDRLTEAFPKPIISHGQQEIPVRSHERLMVAFSGGADSAFLLAAAVRALGPSNVAAATAYPKSALPSSRS